jgi:hypothetical protein
MRKADLTKRQGIGYNKKNPHPCEVWALPGLVDQGWHRHGCGTIFNSSLQPKAWAYLRKVVNDGG